MSITRRDTRTERRGHRLRYWHRWLGMGSLVFVLILSVTGIALNHSSGLRLDQRFVQSSWVLGWYGIEAPEVVVSFDANGARATLMGDRVYLDEREIANAVTSLNGAVSLPRFLAVATSDAIFLLTHAGALVERMPVAGLLPGEPSRVGLLDGRLLVESAGAHYRSDPDLQEFELCEISEDAVTWSEPSGVPDDRLIGLQQAFRGQGVSVERLIADLHSGRLFTEAGPLVMDAVGVILIALSAFGIMLWVRGNPRGNGSNGRRTGR